MAFRALRGVDDPPRGYLLVLGLGCRAIVSAAAGGGEEEHEQPAGRREAVSRGSSGDQVALQVYVTSTWNLAIALHRIPSRLSGTRSGWTLPSSSVARVASTCVPGVAFQGNSNRTRL